MNLTSFFVANLLPLANLMHFLSRVISDGEYKVILLVSDDSFDAKTNIVPELIHLAHEKYSMVFLNEDRAAYSLASILETSLYHRNSIFLLPMSIDEDKAEIWEWFLYYSDSIRNVNTTVIFYENEISVTEAIPWRRTVEMFGFEHNPFRVVGIDVGNSAYEENQITHSQSDPNSAVVEFISAKIYLIIYTATAVSESVINRTMRVGNSTLINPGDSELYLSNFIARNLNANNVSIEQVLVILANGLEREAFECSVSNEKNYAEIYNTPLRESDRFVCSMFFFNG